MLHITEAELVARYVGFVLKPSNRGTEVIVERNAQPIAVMRAPAFRGRRQPVIAARDNGFLHATLDDEFGKDLEDIINSHRAVLNPVEMD